MKEVNKKLQVIINWILNHLELIMMIILAVYLLPAI